MSSVSLENISQLKVLEPQWLDQIVTELQSLDVGLDQLWREPYPEYGSAGLKVSTLINPTGEQENFDYRDCHNPQFTPLLHKLPTLLKFFSETPFQVMGSRLLRLDPGTFLHEHRDFVYLEPVPRFRLHIPLITNPQASITAPGVNVHFQRGYLWKLDPKQTIHSACNFGPVPRVHLMLDCYVNDALAELVQNQFFDETLKTILPPLTADRMDQLLNEASALLPADLEDQAKLIAAEEILLKTFCQYDLTQLKLTTYDLLFELYSEPQYKERKNYWQERLTEVYPPTTQPSLAASV